MNRKVIWALSLAAFVAMSSLFGPSSEPPAMGQSPARPQDPGPDTLVGLKMKYTGAAGCAGDACHGAPKPAAPPARAGNEQRLWSGKDKHKDAFASLTRNNVLGQKISKALKISDATTSDRCLNCHALNVPAPLRGDKYNLREGVTCDACHGPSGKWLEPHKEVGWLDKQLRATGGHAKVLSTWGLYDTRPVIARAERCTACHLSIDAELVAVGHPQPVFELDYYSRADFYTDRHWQDPKEKYFTTRVWAAGQIVALRHSMQQLAARAGGGRATPAAVTDAYQQGMSHYAMVALLTGAGGVRVDAAAMDGQAKALAAAVAAKKITAAPAQALVALASKAEPAFDAYRPDKASALKMLQQIAADTNVARQYGKYGQEQQAGAIDSLYRAYSSAEAQPNAQQVIDLIGEKLFAPEGETLSPDQFAKNLAEVRQKLPK